ncbi:MAG: hypothetical protein HON43_06265 [Alphaproteobacteria bacterium]|nr:hypothetical protein [Alphaproteobacteria bacterium]
MLKNLRKLGFKYISYGVVTSDKKALTYFSDAHWGKTYKKECLADKGPSLHFLMNSGRAMFPWSSLENSDVIRMREEICGIEDGISIYNHFDDGGGAVLGLGVENKKDMNSLAWNFPMSEVKSGMEQLMKLHKKVSKKTFIRRWSFLNFPIFSVDCGKFEKQEIIGIFQG